MNIFFPIIDSYRFKYYIFIFSSITSFVCRSLYIPKSWINRKKNGEISSPWREGVAPLGFDRDTRLAVHVVLRMRRRNYWLATTVPSHCAKVVRPLRHEAGEGEKTAGFHVNIRLPVYSGSCLCKQKYISSLAYVQSFTSLILTNFFPLIIIFVPLDKNERMFIPRYIYAISTNNL